LVRGVPDRLGFGDGTGGPNAAGEITFFEYRAVPEPATLLLVGFGLGSVTLRKRK
jgi:hypothetical protein